MKKKILYLFDLDGVLADWVAGFEKATNMNIDEFNRLSREERNEIKKEFVNYDFFINLPVFDNVVEYLLRLRSLQDVKILSAHGSINKNEVIRAKKDWVVKHISPYIEVLLCEKIEQKYDAVEHLIADYDKVVLLDDRIKAVNEFNNKAILNNNVHRVQAWHVLPENI